MKKEMKIGKTKINLKLSLGWKESTTFEKVIGILTWTMIVIVICYLIFK
jgi:hypothetical protein|nr:MAG TPA: Protein of unknown function (DUF4044) [Caudoviricetes sp.]